MFDIIKQNYFKGRLKNNFNNNMNINNKKGFTLIELMVVIAIIGILVGIIIVSLNKSTDQAKDAKVRSAMGQLRSVAQIYYNNHEYKFSGLASDSEILAIESEIKKNGGTFEIKAGEEAWAAMTDTPTGRCLCVDSTGAVVDKTSGCSINDAKYFCEQ
jgi:prepilin-type N-terminal cleavage/methylation domain-containing protein